MRVVRLQETEKESESGELFLNIDLGFGFTSLAGKQSVTPHTSAKTIRKHCGIFENCFS